MILVALTMVCLASLILALVSNMNGDQLNAQVKDSLRRSNNLLVTSLNSHEDQMQDGVQSLIRRPDFQFALKKKDKPKLAAILKSESGQQRSSLDGLIVFNALGKAVAKGTSKQLAPTLTKDLLKELSLRCPTAIAGTNRGVALSGSQLVLFVVDKVPSGASIVGLNLLEKSDLKDVSKILETDLAIFKQGKLIETTVETKDPSAIKESTQPEMIEVGAKKFWVMSAPFPGRAPGSNLNFAALVKYGNVAMGYDHQQQWLLMVFALALLGAVVSGVFISVSLTKPLESVIFAAKVIQQGAWPARLSTKRKDEIGLLQNVFDEMTVSMRVSQERLMDLVNKDPLTELFNHTTFKSKLETAVGDHDINHGGLAMMIIDPDHFGEYNKAHGHKAGDEALEIIARTIRHSVPETAVTSRYGGEEFGIFLPYTNPADAAVVAENVRRRIEFALGQTGKQLTVSVGYAMFPEDARSAELLALGAELGTTMSKQKGRNKTCRFIPSEAGGPEALNSFLKDGSSATVLALAQAVDAKDPYTHGHSTRVAEYARDLAAFVNLSDNVVELVFRTGQLHDVGKIGVPDAILQKPGRLDDEEREVMEQHPELGEKIVAKVPHLSDTLPGIRGHHERWDGRGYPDGLSGETIPLVARLLAVADTYDAMTSDRPYRKGLDIGFSINEIEKGAGTQFDPHLAKAFAIMMRERLQIPRAA